jgi:tetratricopeptide (TPR) repeat protein
VLDFPALPSQEEWRIGARIDLARLLTTKGLLFEAEEVLNERLDLFRDQPERQASQIDTMGRNLLLEAAATAHGLVDFKRAAVLYEQLCNPSHPDSPNEWIAEWGLGICLAQLKHYETAIKRLRVCCSVLSPNSEEAQIALKGVRLAWTHDRNPPLSPQALIEELRELLAEGIENPITRKYDVQRVLANTIGRVSNLNDDEVVRLLAEVASSSPLPEARAGATRDLQVHLYNKALRDYNGGSNGAAAAELEALLQGEEPDNPLRADILLVLSFSLYNLKQYSQS